MEFLVVIEPGDSRHVRVFGADSLYAGVLERLGLANGWQGGTEFAFAAPVPLTDLAGLGDVQLVLHGAPPVQVAARLERSALWAALGPVRAGRVVTLPRRNAFGGLPSPLAFAGDLGAALCGSGWSLPSSWPCWPRPGVCRESWGGSCFSRAPCRGWRWRFWRGSPWGSWGR